MDNLDDIKSSLSLMLDVTGCPQEGRNHCPTHNDRNKSFSIYFGNGAWRWKCFAQCGGGTVIDFMILNHGKTFYEAVEYLRGSQQNHLTHPPVKSKIVKSVPPRDIEVDGALARRYADDLEHDEQVQNYLFRTRGITADVAAMFGMGVKDVQRDATNQIIGATWTFTILSHEESRPVAGIKCHVQPAPVDRDKCYWLTKGVRQTRFLYPLPEAQSLTPNSKIWIAPGELKALCYLSAGLPATSRTTGEEANWSTDLAERFRGLEVVIDPDRDDSNAAATFIVKATTALQNVAAQIGVLSND